MSMSGMLFHRNNHFLEEKLNSSFEKNAESSSFETPAVRVFERNSLTQFDAQIFVLKQIHSQFGFKMKWQFLRNIFL